MNVRKVVLAVATLEERNPKWVTKGMGIPDIDKVRRKVFGEEDVIRKKVVGYILGKIKEADRVRTGYLEILNKIP